MKSTKNKVPIIVTTAHKGVFFGYGIPTKEKTIRIEQAQMCVYWSADVKSVVGLAAKGPTKSIAWYTGPATMEGCAMVDCSLASSYSRARR